MKSICTHMWHLKGSILKHNMKNALYKFMCFTIQGSLLWGNFPDQGWKYGKNRLEAISTFCLLRWNFSLNRPILCPLSNFLCFWLANSISSYLYRNVTKDKCIIIIFPSLPEFHHFQWNATQSKTHKIHVPIHVNDQVYGLKKHRISGIWMLNFLGLWWFLQESSKVLISSALWFVVML